MRGALGIRVGQGFDAHRLTPGRRLVLAGVEVGGYPMGLAGHSDGDVVVHALIDALLGAATLGDIGQHFPSEDEGLRGVSSLLLLKRIKELLKEHGWTPLHLDATVVAQQPRLSPLIPEMRKALATALEMDPDEVSVKATTTDHLGFAGREEGIAAFAVATIASKGGQQ